MQQINIRAIQHYLYCPRRFGLLQINDDWQENALVVRGNLIHERVHSGEHSYSSKLVRAESAVQLFYDELEIFGVADCIEFRPNEKAEYSPRLGGRYDITIVEYKPTRPKVSEISETDAIQVFAQKLYADSIHGVKCAELFITERQNRNAAVVPLRTLSDIIILRVSQQILQF